MSYADRVQRDLDEWDRVLWQEHGAGEHPEPEPDCARCQREMREALNVEGDPTLNGAFAG